MTLASTPHDGDPGGLLALQLGEDLLLGLGVDRRGGLVEHSDPSVAQVDRGQGESLPLPARKADTVELGAELGVEPVGHRTDDVADPSGVERNPHLLVADRFARAEPHRAAQTLDDSVFDVDVDRVNIEYAGRPEETAARSTSVRARIENGSPVKPTDPTARPFAGFDPCDRHPCQSRSAVPASGHTCGREARAATSVSPYSTGGSVRQILALSRLAAGAKPGRMDGRLRGGLSQ